MRSNDRRPIVRASLLSAALLLLLSACGGKAWENVATLETGEGDVTAGSRVQLEPADFKPADLSGSEFAVEKFVFNGRRLDTASDLALVGKVTLLSGSGNFHSAETLSSDTTRWAASELQKEITIEFPILPMGRTYSGKGHLYFYLVDFAGSCVSNIVSWPVTFR